MLRTLRPGRNAAWLGSGLRVAPHLRELLVLLENSGGWVEDTRIGLCVCFPRGRGQFGLQRVAEAKDLFVSKESGFRDLKFSGWRHPWQNFD